MQIAEGLFTHLISFKMFLLNLLYDKLTSKRVN
jgi:hypothetical protein